MKVKLHPYLAALFSPHFKAQTLPKLVFQVSHPFVVTRAEFEEYFLKILSIEHRQHALYFFMTEIVEMVNKTNGRLLYEDILSSLKSKRSENQEEAY